jgi:hypothetical protein
MQVYIIKISTPKYNPIFGVWRDPEQAKGFIGEVQKLQQEEYNDPFEYFNKVRKFLAPYCTIESQESFLKGSWDNRELEALLDLLVSRNAMIFAFEVQDEFYGENMERRFRKHIK